jgi:endonuclease/exonuclease/phosphatase family metal-dependent hydrolase
MRVATWNIKYPREELARRRGELLRKLEPDLILLQEVNPRSAEAIRQAAGADWLIPASDLMANPPQGRAVKKPRVVAIAGRGQRPTHAWLQPDVYVPERILLAQITLAGRELTAVSYHAPDGESWGIEKARQAVTFARWLAARPGPVIMGSDGNTPEIDTADFAKTRTHWHTGDRHLHGEPGDDLLFGPAKIHALDDAYRRWLDDHPAEASALARSAPSGPLAATYRTGKSAKAPGSWTRFDSIWATRHWAVQHIDHLYDDAIAAGSDHAVVIADLTPM